MTLESHIGKQLTEISLGKCQCMLNVLCLDMILFHYDVQLVANENRALRYKHAFVADKRNSESSHVTLNVPGEWARGLRRDLKSLSQGWMVRSKANGDFVRRPRRPCRKRIELESSA